MKEVMTTKHVLVLAFVGVILGFVLNSYLLASDGLNLLSPNGGEVIQSGTPYTILWEAPPEAVKFDMVYSTDNGSTWELIENNITGTSYEWDVPVFTENRNNCRIQITGYNSYDDMIDDDASNMAFTIEAGY